MVSGFFDLISGLVFGVLSLTFVFDISDKTISVIVISHNLDTAVRKVDSVRTFSFVTITGFRGFEVSIRVTILDSISILVLGGNIRVGGFLVGSGLVGRGAISGSMVSNGNAGNEGNKGNLELGFRVNSGFFYGLKAI